MRAIVLVALSLVSPICLAGPALADQITATSRITAVTVYPEGAEVVREVRIDAPSGAHDLLITDLPQATLPNLIRLSAPEGLGLGAFALRTDRLAPRDDLTSPALTAAKSEVEVWQAKERAALAAIEAIDIKVEAAEAQAAFLANTRAEGDSITPEALKALSAMIGSEVLAAKETAMAARAGLPAAQDALTAAQEGLAKARAAEAAVLTGAADYATLSVAINAPTAGEQLLTVTHFVGAASWSPVYDLFLSRGDTPSLLLKRGVLVSQYSGEDWQDVTLTLSTAQPSAQAAPSPLWPDLRQIFDPATEGQPYARTAASDTGGMMEAVMEPAVVEAAAALEGDTVVYRYPVAVDVATGVENLRLALDEKSFAPKIYAQAVPRQDKTAFVMAEFTNDSGEILLPGEAFLMREGVLVGSSYMPLLAAGAETEIAFGAIEGLRLKRDMPERAKGDRGFLSGATQLEEKALLEVENLTGEIWPVRLLDRVPYSEQEDLEIRFEASPKPAETNVDGLRGVLAWEFDLPPGETKAVSLTHTLRWPQGMELR